MEMLFVICAVLGGTLLVAQFALGLLGFGHEGFDHDIGGDVGHDFGGPSFGEHSFGGHDAGSHDAAQAGTHSSDSQADGNANEQAHPSRTIPRLTIRRRYSGCSRSARWWRRWCFSAWPDWQPKAPSSNRHGRC